MTGNNNFEKEILRLIYSKFDTIKSFTLPFNELKQDSFFLNESILEINFELKKLTDKGFLNVLESKPLEALIQFKIDGFLYYEKEYLKDEGIIDPDRDGIPLYINIEIIPQDSIDYPENLIPTRIWLKQEDMFISRILPEESDISNPNRLHKVVHNGPKDLNGDIDVYIQLIYENSEIFYLVSFNNSIQYTS